MATATVSAEDIKKTAIEKGLKVAKLVCVSSDNNNKYFDMYQQNASEYMVIRGRVDVTVIIEGPYPMSKWDVHYNDKTKANKKPKPYTDHTQLFAENKPASTDGKKDTKKSGSSNFHSKRATSIINFVTELQRYANASVAENYTVSAANVTKRQVEFAQETLNQIIAMVKTGASAGSINDKLMEFYQIIPRRMSSVWDHLLMTKEMEKYSETQKSKIERLKGGDKEKLKDAQKEMKEKMHSMILKNDDDVKIGKDLIGKEQDTLDVMAGQVAVEAQEKKDGATTETSDKKEYDLLHAMNLDMEEVSGAEVKMLKEMLDANGSRSSNLFVRAYKVKNDSTEKKFDKYYSSTKNKKKSLLWHGSRNENWWSIFQQGLILRPTNAVITGKMFGYGIYFADKATKSINYSSYSGAGRSYTGGNSSKAILAVYEIHQGRQFEISRWKNEHSQLTEDKMIKMGYDSVYAKGGYDLANNEYIVYNDSQCTIKYLVQIGN